jgi:transposase-like protein/DNA-directed RNA polymerase subunit RPC12/RpoP
MDTYPKNLEELEKTFSTEEACHQYLVGLRWPDGFRCPDCGHEGGWLLKDGLYKCKDCGRKTSVTAGTIFEGTRKSLMEWFRAIWWVTSQKNGASALGLQRVLDLKSYKTAWTWMHKLRRAMVRPGQDRLSGTVQVDETFIGGVRPGKRGRGAEGKALVFIVAEEKENTMGRIRLRMIADASASSLEAVIQETVTKGSKIKTDGWRGYNGVSSLGYEREIIRKTEDIGKNLLPLCHRVASLVKRWLGGTHQGAASHEHLGYYLDEYTFRFNRRTSKSRGLLFYRLLQNAVAIEPTGYKDIALSVRGKKPKHKM